MGRLRKPGGYAVNLYEDKIYRFLDECDKAGLRNPAEFLISKMPQVYSWLKGAFPRGILPTDVDGEVEINGHFLRLEFKYDQAIRDGAIPKGQSMLFKALQRTKYFSILLIGIDGETGKPTCCQVYYPGHSNPEPLKDVDQEGIFNMCARWAKYAEQNGIKSETQIVRHKP